MGGRSPFSFISMTALKKGNLKARLCLSHIFTHFTGKNIKDELTFRKYSKSPVNVLFRLKHGIHVFLAYFITRELNQKKKNEVFGANLNINRWERYVNYKAVQYSNAQTVVIRS